MPYSQEMDKAYDTGRGAHTGPKNDAFCENNGITAPQSNCSGGK